jgi:hypothetical protein
MTARDFRKKPYKGTEWKRLYPSIGSQDPVEKLGTTENMRWKRKFS